MSAAHPTEPGTQLPGGGLLFGIPGTASILLLLIRCSSLSVMPVFTLNSGTSKHGPWLGAANWLLMSGQCLWHLRLQEGDGGRITSGRIFTCSQPSGKACWQDFLPTKSTFFFFFFVQLGLLQVSGAFPSLSEPLWGWGAGNLGNDGCGGRRLWLYRTANVIVSLVGRL